jgi:hypothetical protein
MEEQRRVERGFGIVRAQSDGAILYVHEDVATRLMLSSSTHFPLQSDGGPYISASSNFPRTPPARMRLWSASAWDQIDGGITLYSVVA